ncbi:MAG: GNAT family N-acetyltransferase [Chloroflexi bacterium HGW-Chloroflexi-9]|nr:MAG: GNAT family N-acetyltransferase [Chloroflexi bacterium HGW-Chloroflexi-9]
MTSTIRLAIAADAPAIQAIYAPIVRDTFISFEVNPPSVEEMAARITSTVARYPYLVLDDGGAVRGYAYASTFRPRAAYDWSVETTIYLRDDSRGTGVGRALYEGLIAALRAAGYRQAYAGIALPNEASVALHERVGFTHMGTFERAGYKMGDWRSVGWWQLLLPVPPAGEPPPPTRGITEVIDTTEVQDALRAALAHLRR